MDYKDYRSKYNSEPVRKERSTPTNGQQIVYAIAALSVLLVVVVALLLGNMFSRPDFVARSVTVEAGRSAISPTDFLIDKSHTAEFGDGVSYSLSEVGEYKIRLIVDGSACVTKLIVVDTNAPTATVTDLSVWQGTELHAEDCVSDIKDATNVEVKFKKKPNLDKAGRQDITVILEDGSGNKTEYSFVLTVVDEHGLLYTHYVSELGDELPSADVFTGREGAGKYLSELSGINKDAAGIYMLQVLCDDVAYDVVLEIADRTPPTATVTPQTCYNKIPAAADFISNIV